MKSFILVNILLFFTYQGFSQNFFGSHTGEEHELPTIIINSITTGSIWCEATVIATVTNDGNSNVTERGLVYSSSNNDPQISNAIKVINGSGTGSFNTSLSSLQDHRTYYFKAYAINSVDTAYSNIVSHSTDGVIFTNNDATNITATSVTVSGNIDANGFTIYEKYIRFGKLSEGSKTYYSGSTGDGQMSFDITGLSPNTVYYHNLIIDTDCGSDGSPGKTFRTLSVNLPIVQTAIYLTDLQQTTAQVGGVVIEDGGDEITEYGVCWNETGSPTLNDNSSAPYIGDETGFISELTNLSPNTNYYARTFATNSAGTAYGNQIEFTTLAVNNPLSVNTSNVINITSATATCGGNVTDEGSSTVTQRGIVWNVASSGTPDLNNHNGMTTDGSGLGSFSSSLAGLSPFTEYYVRAYAINSQDTVYGDQISFITSEVTIECNGTQHFPNTGQVYPGTFSVVLGSATGDVTVNFNAQGIPDQFIIELGGEIVLNTGYRGESAYNFGGSSRSSFTSALNGKVDPTGGAYPNFSKYTDDGYPLVISDQNDSGSGVEYFTKLSANSTSIIKVYAPMSGTAWSCTVSCPDESLASVQYVPVDNNFLKSTSMKDIEEKQNYIFSEGTYWEVKSIQNKLDTLIVE